MSDLLRDRDQAEDAGAFDSYRDDRRDGAHRSAGPAALPADPHDPILAALRNATARHGWVGTPGSEPPC